MQSFGNQDRQIIKFSLTFSVIFFNATQWNKMQLTLKCNTRNEDGPKNVFMYIMRSVEHIVNATSFEVTLVDDEV